MRNKYPVLVQEQVTNTRTLKKYTEAGIERRKDVIIERAAEKNNTGSWRDCSG